MAEQSFQEKTEQATPKKREEARKKGQVAKSRELSSVAVLLSGLFVLFLGGGYFFQQTANVLSYYLSNAGNLSINTDNLKGIAWHSAGQLASILAPLFLVLCVVGFLANILQVGFLISFESIKPKLSKISPAEGMKRLFSAQAMAEFLKSLLKIAIVGTIAFFTVKGEIYNLLPLLDQTPSQILSYLGQVSFAIFWRTCLVMAILATLDFLFQRWEFERNLRMTKQDVKEEFKQTEGDPHVRSRIRSIQREMARKRMMAAVPEADVVITNPTRLAVALKYEAKHMDAPTVVAKGSGLVAEKIRDLAREHGIPIIENKPLAQGLFKLVEVGKTIPETLYQAVAEVLAYVYSLEGNASGRMARRGNR
jgi:flagellar biosynthetic protein FlhB